MVGHEVVRAKLARLRTSLGEASAKAHQASELELAAASAYGDATRRFRDSQKRVREIEDQVAAAIEELDALPEDVTYI